MQVSDARILIPRFSRFSYPKGALEHYANEKLPKVKIILIFEIQALFISLKLGARMLI
jgi:hypothetical protein